MSAQPRLASLTDLTGRAAIVTGAGSGIGMCNNAGIIIDVPVPGLDEDRHRGPPSRARISPGNDML